MNAQRDLPIKKRAGRLTKRIWLDYFNEVLWAQKLIDWDIYQKMGMTIRQ